MPTTRSQSLPADESLVLTHAPRTRKEKADKGHEAPRKTEVSRPRKKNLDKGHEATNASENLLPSSVAQSPLFKLPAELRTMIYCFALLTGKDIEITEAKGIPEPALLSVSKVLRSETYKVFYFENNFACMIEHYNPATLLLAQGKSSKTDPKLGIRAPKLMIYHDQRHWGNLVRWLHLCLQGKCYSWRAIPDDELPKYGFEYTPEERLLGGLFKFIVSDKPSTPNRLDLLLECMRPALIATDKAWGKD